MDLKDIVKRRQTSFLNEMLLLIVFIFSGIVGRTILVGLNIQPFPNFEIIMVLTFLAALFIRPAFAFLVPLFAMIGSDLLLGNPIFIGSQMNKIVMFTYTGFLMIALISTITRKQSESKLKDLTVKHMGTIVGMGIVFVLMYDLWTNFGWWYLMFPHTVESFIAVFTAGIPFMLYHMISAALTFTFIAIPISFFMYHKTQLSSFSPYYSQWEKTPLVAVILVLLFFSLSGVAMEIPEESDVWLEDSDETSIHIVIEGSDWSLQENVCVYGKTTVLDVLKTVTSRNDISLQTEYYESFDATLINAIHTDTTTEDAYWQFSVNGKLSMTGSDVYIVENGDVVHWSYEEI